MSEQTIHLYKHDISAVGGASITMMNKIDQYLEDEIRPYLAEHGGDVEAQKLEAGVLKIKLLGQCSGCYTAQNTVEGFIEEKISKNIPEVKKVELVNDVSADLYNFAKKILNQKGRNR